MEDWNNFHFNCNTQKQHNQLKDDVVVIGLKFYFQTVSLNLFYSMSTWYTPKHEDCNTFLPNRILQVNPFPLYKSRKDRFFEANLISWVSFKETPFVHEQNQLVLLDSYNDV